MNKEAKIQKLLLMGRSNAGKTSMHSIIFANYPAKSTTTIGLTIDVHQAKFRFMGSLNLHLWDCGGQDKLMEKYFTQQKEQIFKNVAVLIYVFDVESEGEDAEHDYSDFRKCLQNLQVYSKEANIFILVHKLDKIRENQRAAVFEKKSKEIQKVSENIELKEIFGTSIWDETLYKAWSTIVQHMIPNMPFIKESLKQLSNLCDCDEIVLFEKSTFLIIAYHENKVQKDILKYERLSNIIKQFKLSCNKMGAMIKSVQVKNSSFTAFIEEFTDNTNVMVVFSSEKKIQPAAIELNIQCARKFFQKNQGTEQDNLLFKWK